MSTSRSSTRKLTAPDPRDAQPVETYVSSREAARRTIEGYKIGHEEAVNQTVDMSTTTDGRRALNELLDGDAKPYRATMRRNRRSIVD